MPQEKEKYMELGIFITFRCKDGYVRFDLCWHVWKNWVMMNMMMMMMLMMEMNTMMMVMMMRMMFLSLKTLP